MNETYEANVRIRKLPRETDRALTTLAAWRRCPKWEVVRDALTEYAERHLSEVTTTYTN